jgi:hypothetical protein
MVGTTGGGATVWTGGAGAGCTSCAKAGVASNSEAGMSAANARRFEGWFFMTQTQ